MTQDKNALYLPVGAIVGPPPSGQVAILADTDGSLKSMDSTGTKSGLGGGSTTLPANTIGGNNTGSAAALTGLTPAQILTMLGVVPLADQRAQALVDAQTLCNSSTLSVISGSEFDRPDFVVNTSSGGTAALSATDKSGVVKVQSNTTAFGTATVSANGTAAPVTCISNIKTDLWCLKSTAKMSAINTTATTGIFLFGTGSSQVFFGLNTGVSTTNWCARVIDEGGTTRLSVATTVAIDTSYHVVRIWNDGTNINFSLDGTAVATVAVSALASGGPAYWKASTLIGSGANMEIDLDRLFVVTASN